MASNRHRCRPRGMPVPHLVLCVLLALLLLLHTGHYHHQDTTTTTTTTTTSSSQRRSILVGAVLERDPVYVRRDGYVLTKPDEVDHFCPRCSSGNSDNNNGNTICCYGQMTGQYTCLPDYTAHGSRLREDWVCEPHGGVACNPDPSLASLGAGMGQYNYSSGCESLYMMAVTCSISNARSGEENALMSSSCPYVDSNGSEMPKCVRGLITTYCANLAQMATLDPVVYGLFLLYELFCGILALVRIRHQPLRARKPINVIIGYVSGLLLGAIYPTFIVKYLPCPLFLNVFIVVLPMFLFSYVARSIYFFALWRINNMKLVATHVLRKKKSFDASEPDRSASFSAESARKLVAKIQRQIKRYESKTEEERALIDKARNRQRRYRFLTNDLILVAMYAVYLLLANIVWGIVVGVYSQDTIGQVHYWTVRGCFANEVVLIVVFALCAIMFFVLLVFAVLMRHVRDAYNLWITTFLDVLLAGLMATLVLGLMTVELVVTRGPAIPHFNSNNIVMIWIALSHTIQITYPAIHSFFWSRSVTKMGAEEGTGDLKSLKTFLQDRKLRRFFESHCRKELSLENPFFWYEVEKYKSCAADQKLELAQEIFQTFVEKDSLMELNVEDWRRREVEERLQSGDQDLFDKLQTDIEILMNDSFARFCRTAVYKKAVNQIESQRTFYKESGLSEKQPQSNTASQTSELQLIDTRARTDSNVSDISSIGPVSPAHSAASPLRRAGSLVHTLFGRSDSAASSPTSAFPPSAQYKDAE